MHPSIRRHKECFPSSAQSRQVPIQRSLLCHPQFVPHRQADPVRGIIHHFRSIERRLHVCVGSHYGLEFGQPLRQESSSA